MPGHGTAAPEPRFAAKIATPSALAARLAMLPRPPFGHRGPPVVLLALALYGAAMWKTKGTTVGGIVFGIKVARLDGREIDWPTAIVRALGCWQLPPVCRSGTRSRRRCSRGLATR